MRWKRAATARARVETVSVLARPGTPSSRTCPPLRSPMSRRSTMCSCPTTTRRTSASRGSTNALSRSIRSARSVMSASVMGKAGGVDWIPASFRHDAQAVAGAERVAVEELGGGHLRAPLALDLEDLDGSVLARHLQAVAGGLDDLARLAGARSEARPVDFEERIAVHRPRGGIGREAAHVVVDLARVAVPTDLGVLLKNLRG